LAAIGVSGQVHLFTKIAKVSGHTKLSPRQQKIVEYMQDYGSLFNRDFSKIFPEVSEDSVLRDLKTLIAAHIIEKVGSTKSSRYELV
jgi:predicted HTH transcriptional regulator